jgi:hAT family C-terminal dimerisation region
VLTTPSVLHPGLKLEYFRQKEWEEDWIENAEAIVREVYIAQYKGSNNSNVPAPNTTAELVSLCIISYTYIPLLIMLQDNDDDFAAFANISVTRHTASRSSEFNEYLRKLVENVKDPLKWWAANRHVYPNLHRMALDYLSIPGKYFIIIYYIY